MILTRDKLKFLIEDFDIIFPEPDPNAKVEDSIGCFKGIVPKVKTGVEYIREQRNKEFGSDYVEREC